jgi:hypothetical protein
VNLRGLLLLCLFAVAALFGVEGSVALGDACHNVAFRVGPSAGLPDCRALELVSPASNLDVNVPYGNNSGSEDFGTDNVFRASAVGSALVYAAEPPDVGNGTGNIGAESGNEWLAVRGADGWSASDIDLPHVRTSGSANGTNVYQAFSSDLSRGFVRSFDQPPLAADAPPNCSVLYERLSEGGGYRALFHSTQTPGRCGEPVFAGASEDDSHVAFQTRLALIPGSVDAPEGLGDLYDSVNGQVYAVNVFNDGTPDPGATFGSPGPSSEQPPDFSHVVSADGSRVFWTDLNTGDLYVRLNDAAPQSPVGPGGECTVAGDACTVQVDAAEQGCASCTGGGGRFWTASSDGSRVFFTDCKRLTVNSTAASTEGCSHEQGGQGSGEGIASTGNDLYEYDVGGRRLSDLTVDGNAEDPLGADVQGVVAVNETGEPGAYVYFVARGVLATDANAAGKRPAAGQPNLYLRHAGATIFIATLADEDDHLEVRGVPPNATIGDWYADPGLRAAESTPDGGTLVFRSVQSLTGYDNGRQDGPAAEVFVYDAVAGRLFCASCNPDGAPPSAGGLRDGLAYQPVSTHSTYMSRWVSADGGSVFFDSVDSLVPQDSNGQADVYEWQRPGLGGCKESGGCISLLSGGTGTDGSFLLDASVSGEDVFFASRSQLVAQASDEAMSVYDARVGGGFPQPSPVGCTGSGCQGTPIAPPGFGVPASVTLTGVGNAPPLAPVLTPKARRRVCPRGSIRKRGVCVKTKRPRKKRSERRRGVRSSRGRKP